MSSIDYQLSQINTLIRRWAPNNISEFPLVMSYEQHEEGLIWWVCLTVKIRGKDDFAIESEDKDLLTALKNITFNLTRFRKASEDAAEADLGFGITYPLREKNVASGRRLRTALDPMLVIAADET
jgi:hypothetical protein